MKRTASTNVPARAAEVLRYYVENPGAVDTLEGIARWRLLDDFVRRRVAETEEALQWLVEHGYLERGDALPAGTPVYRLSTRGAGEAARVLTDDGEGAAAERRRRR